MTQLLDIRIEGEGSREVLSAAKREAKKRLKEGMARAAERTVLPRVRADAPAIVRDALVIKAAVKGPKVTTAGPRKFDRITGLLNYGGTVKTTIAPKDGDGHQALAIGGSGAVVRARVKKPRKYRGKHFVEHAVEATVGAMAEEVLPAVMEVFNGVPHEP